MQKILHIEPSRPFQNRAVTAFFENSKIRLQPNSERPPETFLEMQKRRQPIDPKDITSSLTGEGFTLANLGISAILELELTGKGKFALFTLRGQENKCLSLISGYWDAAIDDTPRDCAERELIEEFLVFDDSKQSFLVPKGFTLPYLECQSTSTSRWMLTPLKDSIKWVPSAQLKATGIDCQYVYIDATTSSAQAVYCYSASFSDWRNLSLICAEDQIDKEGNLITTADSQGIILFELQNNHLLAPGYSLQNGSLVEAELPEDAYFHPSMVGVNQFGIVATDKVPLGQIVS